jgi:hypothetical protein
MAATVERVQVHQDGHWSSRSISILAALAVDAGLVWLLFFRAKYNPPLGEAELFWVRVIAAFGFYAVLQQWTLANQTGRGDDITAALDKFVAASPIVVAAVIEAYWIGAEGAAALSWRHHAVAALWSAFAITNFLCNRHHEPAAQSASVQCWRWWSVIGALPSGGSMGLLFAFTLERVAGLL